MFRRDFFSSILGALALPFVKAKPAEPEPCRMPECTGLTVGECSDEFECGDCCCGCEFGSVLPTYTITDEDGKVIQRGTIEVQPDGTWRLLPGGCQWEKLTA